jgi:HPt (histidine-containing phosphotransfer) domain-containing protein
METVIDTAVALERVEGDEDLLRELAQMLLDNIPEMMDAVRDACARGDADGVERAAHTLKGSSGTLAALAVWDSAQRVELCGRDGDLTGCEELLADLEVEVKRLEEALRGIG